MAKRAQLLLAALEGSNPVERAIARELIAQSPGLAATIIASGGVYEAAPLIRWTEDDPLLCPIFEPEQQVLLDAEAGGGSLDAWRSELLAALAHNNAPLREHACLVCAAPRTPPDLVEGVRTCLEDEDHYVRAAAIFALPASLSSSVQPTSKWGRFSTNLWLLIHGKGAITP